MVLSDTQANLVSLVSLVAPLLWLVWNIVTGGNWRTGLVLLAVAALPLFMGSMMLFGRSFQSRTVYREGSRVAFVDHYEAALFDVRTEPVFLPEGAQASVKEEVRPRSRKYPNRTPSTFHVVYLGTGGQTHAMHGFGDRTEAEARAAELDGLMRGEAARLELPLSPSGGAGAMLFLGGVAYSLGLAVSVLGGRGIGRRGEAALAVPKKPRGKRGGPKSGRSNGRGWKRGR